MINAAVLGSPIAHSLSPLLHSLAYEHLGLTARYEAIEVKGGDLAKFLAGTDKNALSLTMPLKEEALKVANEAIGLLQDQMSECSTRDLVQIFTASVKAHREITEDIVILTAKEAPSEQELAKEYDGKVEELLKRISNF
jgi:hypothetical protein